MALSLIWGSHFFVLIFEKSRSTNMLRILIPICLLLFSCKKEEIELPPFVHPDEVGLEKFYGGDQEDRANEIVVLNMSYTELELPRVLEKVLVTFYF